VIQFVVAVADLWAQCDRRATWSMLRAGDCASVAKKQFKTKTLSKVTQLMFAGVIGAMVTWQNVQL